MTDLETAWWAGLEGDDIRLNTEGDPPYNDLRVAAFLLSKLGMGGRILDVGCGTGRLTDTYDTISGAETVGFDPSPPILAWARVYTPNVAFTDSLPDGPFTGAYSVTVFQHLPAEVCARYVTDVMARLIPDGRFVFQYVEGDEDTFLSHQATEDQVRSWCAGFDMRVDRDPEFEQWRWVTVQ